MSKSPIRKDKTCLNCKYVVENRFCPNCGQENTDTRKTFHHLFIHFFEDLTHYENAFWKTIRNLFLKPASLTKEYLSGKRLSYLAPVRLYIFISFVTFFLMAVFPNDTDKLVKMDQTSTITINDDETGEAKDSVVGKRKVNISDLLKEDLEEQKKKNLSNAEQNAGMFNFGYDNVKELDSIQKQSKEADKLGDWEYKLIRRSLLVKAKYNKEEMWDKFGEAIWNNFPKALFTYMPIFAFILWLFHGKRRWYYFDHGIFTLHYFSFLLLSSLFVYFFNKIILCFPVHQVTLTIYTIGHIAAYIWMFYYFFPAHHRFYGETRTVSFFKSIAMFFINMILMGIVIMIFIVYSFLTIH